jgi:hypothetical protein
MAAAFPVGGGHAVSGLFCPGNTGKIAKNAKTSWVFR